MNLLRGDHGIRDLLSIRLSLAEVRRVLFEVCVLEFV